MTLPPAAGWYPDPGGSDKLRYWNGRDWTHHVSPPDPIPEPAPVARPTAPTTPPAPPAPQVLVAPLADQLAASPPPAGLPVGAAPQVAYAGADTRLGPDGQVLSGWWRRFFGYLLDVVVVYAVVAVVLAIVAAITGGFGEIFNASAFSDLLDTIEAQPGYQPTPAEFEALLGPGFAPLVAWSTGAFIVLSLLNGVVLVAATGQTVGDRMVGNRKVISGRRVPGFGAALLRWVIPFALSVVQMLPLLGLVALAGWILDYLWPLWDQRRQALHDKAARTYVERSALAGPVNR